jgi:uncharacterized protein with NRDE domain
MCLLIFAHQVSPDYPLLVAANRDEFHSRPTAVSDFWPDQPQLLAGRDLLQGGTWMGVTRGGRFAAVTNYRDPARTAAAPRSRGELPRDFLAGSQAPEVFLNDVASRAQDYAGFNLLVGDRNSLWYFTNSDNTGSQRLRAGVYGLSNAGLDTPWPKIELGKSRLFALLSGNATSRTACLDERNTQPSSMRHPLSHDALLEVVSDRQLADPCALRAQGLEGAMDPLLSAQFIVSDGYGTRSSTTLWFDARQQVHWREHSFNGQGELLEAREKTFSLGAD